MVKIYTGKGDDGSTSLWYGGRVPKDDGRTDAYGTLDEANSALGVARSLCGDDAELAADILRVQDELFVAGRRARDRARGRRAPGGRRQPDHAGDGRELEPLIDKYMEQRRPAAEVRPARAARRSRRSSMSREPSSAAPSAAS